MVYDNVREDYVENLTILDYKICIPPKKAGKFKAADFLKLELKKKFKNAVLKTIIRNR